MNKVLTIVVIALIAFGAWWWFTQEAVEVEPIELEITEETIEELPEDATIPVDDVSEDETESVSDVEADHVFAVEAIGREFIIDGVSNPELTVAVGDTVRIEFAVTGGTHDFVIDELGVATEVMSVGGTEVVEFVASEVGSFEYYCSVGNHRAEGMVGVINVVE